MRRDAKEKIESLEKEKDIAEDDKFWGYDKIQEIIDDHVEQIEGLASIKEKDILEI
jgi:ribosome recycling factor